jgi:O-antigen/teichoic acid export membrane protein
VTHGREALRNAGLLLVQRVALAVAAFLFAALVPRFMGPQVYGQYALILSLSTLVVVGSAFGFTEIVGRYVPELSARGAIPDVQRLFGNLFLLRMAGGFTAAVLFFGITSSWLRELDVAALAAAAAAVGARALSHYLFAFFLGLNQAARWGLGELIERWLLLVLVIPGFSVAGFRGACLALLLAELGTLGVGIVLNRAHFARICWKLDLGHLRPHLSFGFLFFAGNLLAVAFQSSGEVLVRAISGDYTQVSFFGLANGVYLTGAAAIQQLSVSSTALLMSLRAQENPEGVRETLRQMLSWVTAGATTVFFAAVLLGPRAVPLVFGRSFQPVAMSLVPITLTLVAFAVSSAGAVVAVTHDQPKTVLIAGGLRLAAFWSLGPTLIGRWDSFGACVAVLVASVIHACYLAFHMRTTMARALRSLLVSMGLAALFLPLALLRSSWTVDCGLYVIFLAGYASLLLSSGVITRAEVAAAWRTAGPGAWLRLRERVEV